MSFKPTAIIGFVEKAAAPTVNDDQDEGFLVSDIWLDETNDKSYQCLDNTVGAAVWTEITGAGGGGVDVTLHASAVAGGLSIAAQEISNRAASNAQTGYATAAQIQAVEANTLASHSNATDHAQGTDVALGVVGTKDPAVDADKVLYRDSAAADVLVTSTWTQIKAFLKTYFDTLYNKYVHPNHSGEVTSVADGAQTITNKAVTLAKMNDMATASLLGRDTVGVGVPEVLAKATVLSILNVEDGAEANNISDTDATDLTDSGDTTLHDHDGIAENTNARHTQGSDTALGAVGTKDPPIDADKVLYRDSTASDALVTSTWTQVKAFLKTYFDTLYQAVNTGFSSKARGYRATAQAIPQGTWTKVQLNYESFDGLGEFDITTNYRFTAGSAGYYLVFGQVSSAYTVADAVRLITRIYKNGVMEISSDKTTAFLAYTSQSVSGIVYLAATDYLELWYYHSDASSNIVVDSGDTFMTVHRIS